MRFLTAVLIIFILLTVSLSLNHCAYGDRGGFSPIGERVTESGQKAIIAWNGTHEVLLLSTDVSSGNESEVVEIMPLPSTPTISKGEKQSFQKVQELVNTYFFVTTPRGPPYRFSPFFADFGGDNIPTVTIVFQEIIGVHNLTVVNAENSQDLVQWLSIFLENKGYVEELPQNVEGLLDHYIQNKMHFFVIDIIETNSTVKTVDPLIYEFTSSKLYYPLKISTLFSGNTGISLFTIANYELNDNPFSAIGFAKKAQFKIKHETLTAIHTNMTTLFSADPYVCYFSFTGASNSFQRDILAIFKVNLDLFLLVIVLAIVCVGLLLSLFSFLGREFGFTLKNLFGAVLRQPLAVSLILGLVGVSLILSSLVLPLGLGEFGRNGEVLIDVSGIYVSTLTASWIADVLFSMFFFLTIYCYAYLLLHRSSKGASSMLIIGGVYMLPHVVYSYLQLYLVGLGTYTFLIGLCSLVIAGFLSLGTQFRSKNIE